MRAVPAAGARASRWPLCTVGSGRAIAAGLARFKIGSCVIARLCRQPGGAPTFQWVCRQQTPAADAGNSSQQRPAALCRWPSQRGRCASRRRRGRRQCRLMCPPSPRPAGRRCRRAMPAAAPVRHCYAGSTLPRPPLLRALSDSTARSRHPERRLCRLPPPRQTAMPAAGSDEAATKQAAMPAAGSRGCP